MASTLNRIEIIGHLGRAPKVRDFGDRKKVSFSVATNEFSRRGDELTTITHWHNVAFWSPLQAADAAEKFLDKGSKVYVEGKSVTRSYEDSQGEKKQITEIIGRQLILLDRRNADASSEHAPQTNVNEEESTPKDAQPTEENELPF